MFARLLESLDGKSATLFLIAGALLVVFAAFLGAEAITDRAMPEDAFGPPGFAIAALGLLGLYRTVADQSRRTATVGAIGAGILFIVFMVISVASIAEELGLLAPLEEAGPIGLMIVLLAGIATLVSYIPFGIASIRSRHLSLTVGLLLFAMPATFFIMLGQGAAGVATAWNAFALGSTQAVVHLGIGFTLPRASEQSQATRGGERRGASQSGARAVTDQ